MSLNETAPHIVEALLELRRRHPRWGAKKLLPLLGKRHPSWDLPARTTVFEILNRHGMVPKKRRRRAIGHPGRPTSRVLAPNDLWCADFKGEFKTGDGIYCYPLTVTDDHSRYLLGSQGLLSTKVVEAKPVSTRLFKEYGLPKRIRTDNGVPFATNTLARLSKLSAWWVRLGVLPELIEPGKPQQNARHERMHRTLKAEATRPPAGSCRAQQRKFNHFRDEFNQERPHEALDMHTTASCYEPATGDAEQAPTTRIPRSILGPLRQRQRRDSLEETRLGERLHRVHRRVRRAGGDRRRGVGRLLRAAASWALARPVHAHRGCLRSAAAAQPAANNRPVRPIVPAFQPRP
jgi:transposase InsO family protein